MFKNHRPKTGRKVLMSCRSVFLGVSLSSWQCVFTVCSVCVKCVCALSNSTEHPIKLAAVPVILTPLLLFSHYSHFRLHLVKYPSPLFFSLLFSSGVFGLGSGDSEDGIQLGNSVGCLEFCERWVDIYTHWFSSDVVGRGSDWGRHVKVLRWNQK